MLKVRLAGLLVGAAAITGLSGCEQIEQAANEAVDKARQTAVKTLDEARQAGSLEEAKQSADSALQDVRQQAAGLLQQASDYLSGEQQVKDAEQPTAGEAPVTDTSTGG